MRAIDADEFKDYIRSGYEEMKHLFNENLKVATLITESFCKDIDEQPTVQPEPHWIPVTERLPEESGCYLVSVKNDHERRYSKTAWFEKDAWLARQDVTAWMPLPEAYKGAI